jgi:hypothetical protein
VVPVVVVPVPVPVVVVPVVVVPVVVLPVVVVPVVVVPVVVVPVPVPVVVVPVVVVPVVVVPVVVVPVPVPVVVVAVVVSVGVGGAAHSGRSKVLLFRVTAPFRASARPVTVVPFCTVIDVSAMMVPTKVVPVPRVAELPTCQNTLHGSAPLVRATVLFEAVIRVDPAWKIHTELGSFCPSR